MVGAGESRAWPPGHAMGTRWMAPESLLQWEWSEKSDVYSFGMLMWEIFTDGEVPYAGHANGAMEGLKRRNALPPAPQAAYRCPAAVHALMLACWESNPANRPTFAEARGALRRLAGSDGQGPLWAANSQPWEASVAFGDALSARRALAPEGGGALAPELLALHAAAVAALATVRAGGSCGSGNSSSSSAASATGACRRARERQRLLLLGASASASTAAPPAAASSEPPPFGLTAYHSGAVFSFPLFTPAFARSLVLELKAFHDSGRRTARANSRNRYRWLSVPLCYCS